MTSRRILIVAFFAVATVFVVVALEARTWMRGSPDTAAPTASAPLDRREGERLAGGASSDRTELLKRRLEALKNTPPPTPIQPVPHVDEAQRTADSFKDYPDHFKGLLNAEERKIAEAVTARSNKRTDQRTADLNAGRITEAEWSAGVKEDAFLDRYELEQAIGKEKTDEYYRRMQADWPAGSKNFDEKYAEWLEKRARQQTGGH